LGDHLEKGFRKLPSTSKRWGWRRGLGLMRGIEVLDANGQPDAARAGQLVEAMLARARGIIILSGGVGQNVLSFTPPFVTSEEEIDFALEQLSEAEAELTGKHEIMKT
jgi:4-aminobutyrate aminotransferase-like enzyme